jgi:carbamoyl-phosphate synthase small subunit
VPAQTLAEDVLALKPDGVFLSNGPGDPEPAPTQWTTFAASWGASRFSEFA